MSKVLTNQDISKTKFLISKHTNKAYNYHPQTRDELKDLIDKLIEERGIKADLNDIDTSAITDMSSMFYNSQFDGDISNWDVSNVKNMYGMFYKSDFNGDISKQDVRSVITTSGMFINSSLENNKPAWYKQMYKQ